MLQLSPPIILAFSYLGAALIVAEVGLPTFGLLGVTGFAASGLALGNAVHQHRDGWPLLVPLLAAGVLGLLLMRGRIMLALELCCAAALALAGIAWGVTNHSPASTILGVVLAVATPFGFRRLHAATRRLLDGPKLSGMDALVGQPAAVVTWDRNAEAGSVRVDGSLWNARPAANVRVEPGLRYEVVGHDRLTLFIRQRETV